VKGDVRADVETSPVVIAAQINVVRLHDCAARMSAAHNDAGIRALAAMAGRVGARGCTRVRLLDEPRARHVGEVSMFLAPRGPDVPAHG
jgi:hypothetical protein